ncbi:acyltransferase [Frondihabitans cladoniiphilus]|uniref:Maltose O-acetyltransferase n=1 Tax=Frondihabitans cladoniiphilus TaxID=715785 RepID=A0ABP8W4L9_9MICO
MTVSSEASSTFLSRLGEDVFQAFHHTVFTSILGSAFVPRVARRALLLAGGAHAESGVGLGFSLSGSPRNLNIASGVYINGGVSIEAIAPVTIGTDTAIGMQVLIITSHHEIDESGAWTAEATGRPVTIGKRVWIGGRATILPGAVIEDDVVVAAGAVVAGRLESHGVYGGVPAKRIRELTPRTGV